MAVSHVSLKSPHLQDEIHDKVIFNKFAENIPEWFEKL